MQHAEAELSINMSKKQVCLYQWDYIINCNENKNDDSKIVHVNKTYIDQVIGIETNVESMAFFGNTMLICNKQHLSNIWGWIYENVKQHWGWVEKKLFL